MAAECSVDDFEGFLDVGAYARERVGVAMNGSEALLEFQQSLHASPRVSVIVAPAEAALTSSNPVSIEPSFADNFSDLPKLCFSNTRSAADASMTALADETDDIDWPFGLARFAIPLELESVVSTSSWGGRRRADRDPPLDGSRRDATQAQRYAVLYTSAPTRGLEEGATREWSSSKRSRAKERAARVSPKRRD